MGKKHKHFLSRERHKKLKMMIHQLLEEKGQKEQELKNAERRKIVLERIGKPVSMDGMDEDTLRELIAKYHEQYYVGESKKLDLEFEFRKSDLMIHELYGQVNDLRGKFVKPSLKKVPQYEKTMAKFQAQAKTGDFNFKAQLKHVL
ncbi:unnamed protein product, partial [Meganyctiphanes norvegica]|uniref:Troponin I n=1 Tax=Meganyctiphanes norvegica TaxID=48144 RepID=A0AAV2S553_MEGNR